MKMKIIIAVSMIAYVLAEPPVGDSYNYPGHLDQRSLSQEYGPPAFGSRTFNQGYSQPSEEYGIPALRSSRKRPSTRLSQEYGPPKERTVPSQNYGAPSVRGNLDAAVRDISRQYIPTTRSQGFNSQYVARSANTQDLSQEYGVPETRNLIPKVKELSQEYGVPELRSLSDTITVPSVPSDSYGAPLQRSDIPSEQYKASERNFGASKSPSFRTQSASVSQTYGTPRANYASSSRFNSLNTRSQSRKVSETYGAPARSLSNQYSAASPNFKASYQNSPSETYGAPNERSLSTEYGVPRRSLDTNAFVSSYESARSSPSSTYGPPAGDSMPSDQYGVPELASILSSQGYSYARNALDELLNQEPANYDFGYKVNDLESGSDFGHTETRQENKAEGSYFVVLPDGSKQVVEYEADERGFKPRISVEPAESKGYDENASDLSRSGPY